MSDTSYDEIIKGGTVIDGTGTPGRVADIAIRDGKIVTIGKVDGDATIVTDATGRMVMPGVIDVHTHYDAQLLWDPGASPSANHGVTTIIAGNCGFTLAPLRPTAAEAEYLQEMMSRVEGMPLPALRTIDWNWETFEQYLNQFENRISVNAGWMAGHCAIRRYVMGPESVGGEATPEQIEAMVAELRKAIEVGALGWSFTTSGSHSDGDGQPVPSRWASTEEMLAMATEVGRHEGTSLEGIVPGCLDRFADDEIELLATLSAAAKRVMNWNVLTIDSREPDRVGRQVEAFDRAKEIGGRVVALTMPVLVPMNMNFATFCGIWLLPGWEDTLRCDIPERITRLQDPATRATLLTASKSEEAGIYRRLADWEDYVIGDTFAPENAGLSNRTVGEVAAERGAEPFDTLLDIVIADGLQTILWPAPKDKDPESWRMRVEAWNDERVMIGGSDAGAHLDRMCGATFPTRFLGDMLNGRKLIPIERAVQLITQTPAQLFGLVDRGTLVEGSNADIVVFDPETIGSENAHMVADLPGGCSRLTADSYGIERVLVNGTAVIINGQATGATPGTVLKSGKDTYTVLP
ncbi:MAG: amidohydrolase family protein [Actinobacteria bacterium]|nr:amidohydrolase family protein [Actinomycetota bacterium]